MEIIIKTIEDFFKKYDMSGKMVVTFWRGYEYMESEVSSEGFMRVSPYLRGNVISWLRDNGYHASLIMGMGDKYIVARDIEKVKGYRKIVTF